jgi:putative membrane protein
MHFLIKLLVNTFALLLVVHFIPGIHISDWTTAVFAALGLGIVNTIIKPVVMLLTLPFNILSLGLLTFVINAFLFYLVSAFIPKFTIDSFGAALFGSLLYSVFSAILSFIVGPHKPVKFYTSNSRSGNPRSSTHKRYDDVIDVEGKTEDHTRV